MFTLSFLYFIPAGVILVISLLWTLRGRLLRPLAVLPVWAPYAMCCLMLVLGGLLHRVAHVRLYGVEVDLATSSSAGENTVVLGGSPDNGREERGLLVPGLPPEALGIRMEGNQLKIIPGPGYQRGILVKSGDRLIPLEPGGVPRLVALRSDDTLTIPATEGGEVIRDWRLGTGAFELNTATQRWIGSEGLNAARLPGLPPRIAGLRTEGTTLTVSPAAGLAQGYGITVNGQRLNFTGNQEVKLPFLDKVTRVALVRADPLAGAAVLRERDPKRRAAWVDWTSAAAAAGSPRQGFPTVLAAGQVLTAGGGIQDALFLKGLPPGALSLTLSPAGHLRVEMSKAGAEAVLEGSMEAQAPVECGPGGTVTLGSGLAPSGGTLRVTGPGIPVPQTAESSSDTPPGPARDGPPESGADPAAPPVTNAFWQIVWVPNDVTRMPLTNRVITLPLVEQPVEIFSRRPWMQRIFPLSLMSSRESTLRSAFVYGLPHPDYSINGAHLLQLEPGITITRNGEPLTPPAEAIGVIENGAPLEIFRVLANEDGRDTGNVTAQPLQPGAVYTGLRVRLLRRYAAVGLDLDSPDGTGKTRAVLKVTFDKPLTRSVPMSDVKKSLEQRDIQGLEGVKFGINDRNGMSDLPHQLAFPGLSRWFDDANADAAMNFADCTVQDDYRKINHPFGEPFLIGGGRRLLLTITKETVPVSAVLWVAVAGLLAMASAWRQARSYWWIALMAGTAFLTCSRVLFGQAALVNAPYDPQVIRNSLPAVVLAPLLLGAGAWALRALLPGRLENWIQRAERVNYRTLCLWAAALLVIRVILLLAGAKEAVNPGFRLALSLIFVPAWLLLMAQAACRMWREKEAANGFTGRVALRFMGVTFCLLGCQTVSALLTSDLGMFLYFIPSALILATVGACTALSAGLGFLRLSPADRKTSRVWLDIPSGLLMLVPLVSMGLVFAAPHWTLSHFPGALAELNSDSALVTDSTLLRVLQFADEDYLINIGTDMAERIAQDHAIMDSYSYRGMFGEGYLQVHVLPAKAVTALNDNVSAIYVFAQFGVAGGIAILIACLAILTAGFGACGRRPTVTSWLALLAGMSFAAVSIYMMLANRGHLPFTGRNMYLLGLNSWSDIAEGFILLLFILLGISRSEYHRSPLFPEPETGSGTPPGTDGAPPEPPGAAGSPAAAAASA